MATEPLASRPNVPDLPELLRRTRALNARGEYAQSIRLIREARQTTARDFVCQGFLELELARALLATGEPESGAREAWSASRRAFATLKWDLFLSAGRFFCSPRLLARRPWLPLVFGWQALRSCLANPLLGHKGWQIRRQLLGFRTPAVSRPPPPAPLPSPRRIAVVRLDRLGDLVGSLPALTALRRALPDAQITAYVTSGLEFVLEQAQVADRVVGVSVRPGRKLRQAMAALEAESYDVLIDLLEADRAWEIEFVARAKASVKIGFASRSRTKLYDLLVARGASTLHVSELVFSPLAPLGVKPGEQPMPALSLRPDQRARGAELVGRRADSELLVGIHPGSGYRFRRWPAHAFAELLDLAAADFGAQTVLLGGPGDEQRVDAVAAQARGKHRKVILRSIESLAEGLSALDLLVCLDSGPMHLAGALGKELVVLWGPGRLEMFGPRWPKAHVVCGWAPCMGCPQEGAPSRCSMGFAPEQTACMSAVAPGEVRKVLAAVLARLGKEKAPAAS